MISPKDIQRLSDIAELYEVVILGDQSLKQTALERLEELEPELRGHSLAQLRHAKASALFDLGRPRVGLRVIEEELEADDPDRRTSAIDMATVFLESTKDLGTLEAATSLLAADVPPKSSASLLFVLIKSLGVTRLQNEDAAHVILAEFEAAVGESGLDTLEDFQSYYELFRADLRLINRLEAKGKRPVEADLKTGFWRNRLKELPPPYQPGS